ncbi:MAG: polysaccharide biosynthesis C-terminal domain-containing protein [Lachnospiraceae bacterium]|nr:polysaccharide biosynthesis C-terminal domain-containing protein [Lachnospiraceae bacterium]
MKNGKEKSTSRYKYLAGNIALFTIGNFVSKLLVFLLVPFYTNVLSTADYGIADIMQTTLLLLVPMLTVNMGEAALRFGIVKSDKRYAILRIGIKYILRAELIVAVICLIAGYYVKAFRQYMILFIFLFGANSLYEYLVLFFQGCEKVNIVVSGSILSTLILIMSNILFLLVIKTGVSGYIVSQILAFLGAAVFMLLKGRVVIKKGSSGAGDDVLERELVDFGIPMIAYSTGSFVNNAADRYLVSIMKGVAVNGVYGVAYKIPAMLTVFQRIFAQAWQMSATKSYEDDNSVEFFSQMYKVYNTFMVTGCSFLILTVKALAYFMFKKDFFEAWRYVPLLLISVVFGALTGFLGSICLAYKDSKAMGKATVTGAVVNIVLNLILIPKYSAMGASAATGISYFLMYHIAYIKTSLHVKLKVNRNIDYIAYVLLVIESFIMIKAKDYGLTDRGIYIAAGIVFVLIILIYLKEIIEILNKLIKVCINDYNRKK